jgi:hypothetical protein
MNTVYRNAPRALLGTLMLVAAMVAGRAEAACPVAAGTACVNNCTTGNECYALKGSDTLFDIMSDAISRARANGVAGAANICYYGSGSGNGETAMKSNQQSLAPMSRNFRPTVMDGPVTATCDTGSPDYPATAALGAHQSWAPVAQNVVGLDAAVFVIGSGATLNTIDFNTFTDSNPLTGCAPAPLGPKYTPTDKAVPNGRDATNTTTVALSTNILDGSAFNNKNSTVNYNQIMSVILSGVDGSGTLAACADARRVRAVMDLSTALGLTGSIQHLIRRDDNSGTTDTFKDRIMVVANTGTIAARYPWTGGRFCNGTALGSINGSVPQQGVCSNNSATVCVADSTCGAGNFCLYNQNNQDFDPIRRPCMDTQNGRTNMLSGAPCVAGDASCTQGLVVALSDTDVDVSGQTPPLVTDITTSIANRTAGSQSVWMGYAGREAGGGRFATKSVSINTIRPTDPNVISSTYLLARRLYIENDTLANGTAKDPSGVDVNTNLGTGACGVPAVAAEKALFNSVLASRAIMDPIVTARNFIRCSRFTDGGDPCSESNNLCCNPPFGPVPGTLSALNPSGTLGGNVGGVWVGGRKSIDSQGAVWNGLAAVQIACTAAASYVSGSCAAGGTSPLYTGRPAGFACSQNSDCGSNSCTDRFGHGAPGQVYGLYCN